MSLTRGATVVVLLLGVGLGIVRITSTYRVFTQTVDEPAHIAAGLEYLERGTYWFEPLHPPLARVAVALGPYLDGSRIGDGLQGRRVPPGQLFRAGNEVLTAGPSYQRTLSLARLGTLPFFVLACASVTLLTWSLFGGGAALVAGLFATSLPIVLAHAGLATTDLALAATFTLAVHGLIRFLERPDRGRAITAGLAAGVMAATKLSGVFFLGVGLVALTGLVWLSRRGTPAPKLPRPALVGLALVAAGVLVWSVYGFSLGSAAEVDPALGEDLSRQLGETTSAAKAARWVTALRALPAVEWVAGLRDVLTANAWGRKGYLLGTAYVGGNPLYFPIGLLVKTPLGLLLLELTGLALAWRLARRIRNWQALAPAVVAGAILALVIPSQINIGIRHVLPVFLLALPYAGLAAERLAAGPPRGRLLLAALGLWYLVSTGRAHPDYLPYFNELALFSEEPVLVDSDLDWGQDAGRLVEAVRGIPPDSLTVGYFGSIDLGALGLTGFDTLPDYAQPTGWVAVSLSRLHLGRAQEQRSDQSAWLKHHRPERRIGKSILLYHLPAR